MPLVLPQGQVPLVEEFKALEEKVLGFFHLDPEHLHAVADHLEKSGKDALDRVEPLIVKAVTEVTEKLHERVAALEAKVAELTAKDQASAEAKTPAPVSKDSGADVTGPQPTQAPGLDPELAQALNESAETKALNEEQLSK